MAEQPIIEDFDDEENIELRTTRQRGQIDGIHSYTVLNPATGENVSMSPSDVRNFTTQVRGERGNLRVGRQVEFRENRNWIPGTLIAKNYTVNMDDGSLEIFPHSIMRRQAQVVQAPPPPPPPTPPPQQAQAAAEPTGNVYQVGDDVEILIHGRWWTGQIRGIDGFVVQKYISMSEKNMPFKQEEIRPEYVRDRGANSRLGGPIQYRDESGWTWREGTLIDIVYYCDVFLYGTNRRMSAKNSILRRPTAPLPPPGAAFEVHTAFDEFKANKWDKFMEIINRTTGTNANFRNRETPLQPLIDYVNTNASYTPEKKAEIIQKINRIFTQIQGYSNYEENIDNITNCIQYVLMQRPEFIDAYINTFAVDCFKAYDTGTPESCVKGMYERVYLSFRDAVKTLCLDEIQGTGPASLCKPEYIEIFNCFYENVPQELLNAFASEWNSERGDEALLKLTPEERIEDFVGFVRTRMNNLVRFGKVEASIRRYANKEINTLFGGKRRHRRTRRIRSKRRTAKKYSIKRRFSKRHSKPLRRHSKKYIKPLR